MVSNNKSLAHIALVAIFACQVLIALSPTAEAANILFFIGFGSTSHRLAMQPLANRLAAKGHGVTIISQDKPKNDSSTIQYYVPQKVAEHFKNMRNSPSGGGGINFYDLRANGRGPLMNLFVQQFGLKVCENIFGDPDFMEWFHKTSKFDLVIMDGLFNECGYGLAYAHGAKTIVFSVSTVLPWAIDAFGIPDESSWIPDILSGTPIEMGFANRVFAALTPIFWRMLRQWYYFPALERITREGLKQDNMPSYAELERNTSLMFVNAHPAQELPRALPPNVIPVGGMSWVDKRKPLPKEMESFINEGKEGFIYVSFGSFIDFLTFPEEVQQTFIDGLKQFPNIQFIWKLNETPENLPKHILVEKWLPQQDLLLHPKIKAFITHSGIGGVTEAIYSSVPLICFPLFSEQDFNAQLIEKRGSAIKMEITALKQEDMVEAIRKIITDNSYKENAKKVNKQFLDRQSSSLETAIWYTEYVLRQESTEFLRSHTVDQSWWKKRQLDVWLFLFLLTISINSIGFYVSYKLLKRYLKSKADNKQVVKNRTKRKSKKNKKKQN